MNAQWATRDIPLQRGRRALVTGAASGIGWNTALDLARAGAQVIIAARTLGKGADAAERVLNEVPNADVKVGVMNLSSMSSVQAFAQQQLTDSRPIEILVNNAGVMAIPKRPREGC